MKIELLHCRPNIIFEKSETIPEELKLEDFSRGIKLMGKYADDWLLCAEAYEDYGPLYPDLPTMVTLWAEHKLMFGVGGEYGRDMAVCLLLRERNILFRKNVWTCLFGWAEDHYNIFIKGVQELIPEPHIFLDIDKTGENLIALRK